jgi:O-antigen/teichoic acid export membrane protein
VSIPYPLVSALARNLDAVLPFRAEHGTASRAFRRATVASAGLWTLITAVMAMVAPIVLVRLAGAEYAPAVPAVYPLLVQSLAVGGGVGVAATLRAADRVGYGVVLQGLSMLVALPLGLVLIPAYGAVGGAWTHAVRFLFLTSAGVAVAIRVSRDADLAARQ